MITVNSLILVLQTLLKMIEINAALGYNHPARVPIVVASIMICIKQRLQLYVLCRHTVSSELFGNGGILRQGMDLR